MSLRSRLASIERHVRELHASSLTCPICGGPSPGVNAVMLCWERDGEVVPRHPECPECGLLVDSDGRATPSARRIAEGEEVCVRRIILVDDD